MNFFKKISPNFLILSVWALLIFSIISYLVLNKLTRNFDLILTISIQNVIPRQFDTFLSLFSLIGSFELTTISLVLLLIYRKKIDGFLFLLFFAIGHIAELLGKIFLDYPGPPKLFYRYSLKLFFPSVHVQTGHSYPSGHSFRTAFIIVLIIFIIARNRLIKPSFKLIGIGSLIIFLILMLISRISLGEHWTTDVAAGGFLGTGLCLLSFWIIQKIKQYKA